ncbi:MAG: hypothetical protein ACREBS_11810 [Nitrososphaerales archaeon]
MEISLKSIFEQVEKYVDPLLGSDSPNRFSRDENRILALQQINRLNQRIGMIARSNKEAAAEMKTLQTFINNLTIGVKNDSAQHIRFALDQARNQIASIKI